MAKRHTDLFGRIASFGALRAAAKNAILGKRKKPGASAFMANFERELLRLERELQGGTYRPGRYVEILVRDPKERLVSAAPFRDRVVHHALCAVIEPIFAAGFIGNTFANRERKGTHAAIRAYERYRDRHAPERTLVVRDKRSLHVLRCDIYRYFPSIDHAILKADFRRRIACERTLWLMDSIVDGSNRQEPVNLYFPDDDLFEPYRRRRGLPIGNLTSQLSANLYLDGFDHWVTEVLRAPYVRYMDDFALFHDDPAVLAEWQTLIRGYLAARRLKLHPRKTMIVPVTQPALFLGFELAPCKLPLGRRSAKSRARRLPEDNIRRFRGRLRGLRDRGRAGTIAEADVRARVGAWIAHARHSNTFQLRQAMFQGGWFDPRCTPSVGAGLKAEKAPARWQLE